MIFEYQINLNNRSLVPRFSSWNIKELELENLIVSFNQNSELSLLDENIFNEPLLFIRNQPKIFFNTIINSLKLILIIKMNFSLLTVTAIIGLFLTTTMLVFTIN